MKKNAISLISAFLAVLMLVGVLAACGGTTPEVTTEKPAEQTTEKPAEQTTEDITTEKPTETDPVESTEQPTETTEAVTEPPIEEETEVGPKIESPYIDTIVLANDLANGVQQYYSGVTNWASNNGKSCIIENQIMDMVVLRDKATKNQYVESLKNKDGGVYIENTFDVYIRMADGSVYYTSKTTNHTYTNVYRHGYYYHEIRMERQNFANDAGERVESLQVARIFHTYSDKLHHEIQVCSTAETTTGIDAIGFITEISADKVAKIQIKDASGTHDSLEGVDFASVEYVGFDIIDAGIFGYILPVHKNAGVMTVTLEDGKYVIVQETCPENGIIEPGNSEVLNENDFYAGQRIYTDTTHDFADLEREAYIERNPLDAKSIKLNMTNSDEATFLGYNALRGSYFIEMDYAVREVWNKRQNQHFEANFSIKGDELDRTLYMVVSHTGGALECAVVLDEDLMSLPIPMQVGKNFAGDGDDKNQNVTKDGNSGTHNVFNYADKQYSESIFPIAAKAGDLKEYSVIHMYQNWGNFPLKQITFIHFWVPYYHFSTGLTETNCIYYVSSSVDMLPDHRAMSAPVWADGAQHTSGGQHMFFTYKYSPKDSSMGLNNLSRVITSYGPTYAEIDMTFMSDDGKIKATYTHMEMPQMDENRAYYTMTYEFLEDTNFKAFREYSRLYSTHSRDGSGVYRKLGYLNENNESVIVDLNTEGETVFHTLGDEYPYFDMFYMPTYSGSGGSGYVNTSFIIKDYEVIIDGQKADVGLLLREIGFDVALTLDIDNVKFKKGDTITINAIIMPWGSQESDYSGENYAPDQNVRDVRENTLMNPIKLAAVENCEVVESEFLPAVRTTNGKSTAFMISGGKVNKHTIKDRGEGYYVTVRAYGFEKLTVPKVYELVNGEWIAYELSSKNTPDVLGYTNEYDGYAVHYDEDGRVSYSFVIDMSDAKDRTFMITTEEEFKGFKRIETVEKVLYPYHLMLEPTHIASALKKYSHFYSIGSGEDGGMQYTAIGGTPYNEAYIIISPDYMISDVTGQYVIIKYRIPEENVDKFDWFELYTSTEYQGATGPERFTVRDGFEPDGKWHVVVIDTLGLGYSAGPGAYVKPNENGEIKLNYMRIDIYNQKLESKENSWHIAYAATHDNLEEILSANTDMDYVTVVTGEYEVVRYDPKTGEVIE